MLRVRQPETRAMGTQKTNMMGVTVQELAGQQTGQAGTGQHYGASTGGLLDHRP